MKKLIALSAIGKDQPGIVAALSKVLFEKGCNLEDSSMTRLKGDFAILLLISLPEGLTAGDLRTALEPAAREKGLAYTLRELSAQEASGGTASTGPPYTLVVYGVDHPGIVHRIAQAAADHRVNITDLRTHVTQSQGTDLYTLAMEVDIADEKTAARFREKLEGLKKELKVELTLNPVEAEEL
jgi:glycine cleavage system transcriptional repressor